MQNQNDYCGLINRAGNCGINPFCEEISHGLYGYWVCGKDLHGQTPQWTLINDDGERFGPFVGQKTRCIEPDRALLILNDYPCNTEVEFNIREGIPVSKTITSPSAKVCAYTSTPRQETV